MLLAPPAQLRSYCRTAAAAATRTTTTQTRLRPRALFTGIVQGQAAVIERSVNTKAPPEWMQESQASQESPPSAERSVSIVSLTLSFPSGALVGLEIGASIAVDGVCLTVTSFDGDNDTASFDVIPETLERTTLGELEVGSVANFERAATLGAEIGGHTVSGHICACGQIADIRRREQDVRIDIALPEEWHRFVLEKGYIAIDGVSLTVGEVDESLHSFCVYLIPETLRVTTLGRKSAGDRVNIEVEAQTQAIVTTVERVLRQKKITA